MRISLRSLPLLTLGSMAACGPAADRAPAGRVIDVRMLTDEAGNRFEPSEIDAHPGDRLRFTLVTGVHAVTLRDRDGAVLQTSNTLLEVPGLTQEVTVPDARGDFDFRCEPHVALGMTGKLHVR